MNGVIDLEGFPFIPATNLYGKLLRQGTVLRPDSNQPAYAVYANAAHATAEVAYSRLCRLLGLPCVEAKFAVNLKSKNPPLFASASPINMLWTPYRDWLETRPPEGRLDNATQLLQHSLLRRIAQNSMPEIDGYVLGPTAHFVAANNGGAFYSQGLAQSSLLRRSGVPEGEAALFDVPSVTSLLSDVDWKGAPAEALMRALASLTDDDLRVVTHFPEGTPYEDARNYILPRLIAMRSAGKRVASALDDSREEEE